jgi:hypothetical protein|tara:strand:- start:1305 stop:1658 length:354 start_codon:yes stop_codon:yes gene_type:complete
MSFSKETYRPLPEGLTISQSKIDGLGLHALKDFEAGEKFGETHVLVHSRDRHEWIRTPLGGFINHSDNPNCFITTDAGDRTLYATMPIKEGDEITVYYRFKGYDGIIHNDTEPDIGC